MFVGMVTEQLAIVDWAVDRSENDLRLFSYPTSIMRGQLAESWEWSDAATLIVHIRPGVRWHDKAPMNGRELTASDVEFNYHRLYGIGSGFSEASRHAGKSAAQDRIGYGHRRIDGGLQAGRARPRLASKATSCLRLWIRATQHVDHLDLPSGGDPAARRHAGLEESGWHRANGADGLRRWQLDNLDTKYPNYWGFDEKYPENRLPYVDEIVGLIMPDPAARLAALRSGQIDMLTNSGDAQLRSDRPGREPAKDRSPHQHVGASPSGPTTHSGSSP